MNTQKNNSLGPFIVLTFIYFIVGFLTTVNGQFQGPLKIAFLSHTDELRNTLTTFISFFFFLGYLLNSSLGGKWINVHGYKKTLLRALSIMVIGLLMYSLSSWLVVHYGDARILIFKDQVPYGYFIFLLGSYLMGTSAALLQVVINPYIPPMNCQIRNRYSVSISYVLSIRLVLRSLLSLLQELSLPVLRLKVLRPTN